MDLKRVTKFRYPNQHPCMLVSQIVSELAQTLLTPGEVAGLLVGKH